MKHQPTATKPLNFWACWSLTVGVMVGSGIFLLPSVLAPYGLMSFAGWALTSAGSILLALVIARLSARTKRSGGVYVYTQEAFGNLTGFLVAWGYWAAYWIAIPAIAIAFVGYLGVFFPALDESPLTQAITALMLIWGLTLLNMFSLRSAGLAQVLMTVLKLLPLGVIILLGVISGDTANLPSPNPQNTNVLSVLAITALLTMWAFSGLEAGGVAAGAVNNPERTIPRAIILGTLTVAFVYISSTFAVMLLVPSEILVSSTSPFADAAKGLGTWGPYLIAIGALIATAGSLNGVIFVAGQMPMALAIDGLAPKLFRPRHVGISPRLSLLLGSTLGSILLMMNYSQGLIGMFTLLAIMSTLAVLVPLLVSAAAELKYSWRSAKGWASIAVLAFLYSLFAILGSGWAVIGWGIVFLLAGLPVYYGIKR